MQVIKQTTAYTEKRLIEFSAAAAWWKWNNGIYHCHGIHMHE
jgi:hypothetical protein